VTDLVRVQTFEPDDPHFKQEIVDLANDMIEELAAVPEGGRWDRIQRLIAENDFVIGVWSDPGEPGGVGLMMIKGERKLLAIAAGQERGSVKLAAVPCTCIEQAAAAKEVAGEPPALN
jgi:hypothetical protein